MGKFIVIFVSLVFLVSGCVDFSAPGSSGASSVSGNEDTEIIVSDILSINRLEIIPTNTLSSSKPFTLRLEIENTGDNSIFVSVDKGGSYDGDMLLCDYCSDMFSFETVDSFKMNPSHSGNPSVIEMKPGLMQFFEWKLVTPSEEMLYGMMTRCNLALQVSYDTVAFTNTYIYFATPFEISRSFYTRKNMYLLGSNIATDGPLKVNIVPFSDQPIPIDYDAWSVSINIENLGDGLANVTKLDLVLPSEITRAGIVTAAGMDICNLESAENLDIYKDGSERIVCMFDPPDETVLIATAYKLKAVVDYTYVLKDSVTVTVEPIKLY